ncbi:hypothetical protein BC629DRAFT_1594358 [Irpex lacteus]|nr:hypothetical protein BC629DRAFT_1594358 [Irpex lacteus]
MRFSAILLMLCVFGTNYIVLALPSAVRREDNGDNQVKAPVVPLCFDKDPHASGIPAQATALAGSTPGKRGLPGRACFGILDPTSDTADFKPKSGVDA